MSGRPVPQVSISTAIQDGVHLRARRNSVDMPSIGVDTTMDGSNRVENPDYPTDQPTWTSSSGPSGSASLLRHLTTLRSPLQASRSTRRAQGGSYDTLDDGENDPVAVDLSSLGGGYELTMLPNTGNQGLNNQDTAYTRHYPVPLGVPSIDTQNAGLGNGMIIGAELRRTATKLPNRHADSGHLIPSDPIERARTLRRAQSIAQEHQMIVAVSEAIDISSLEGGRLNHRSSQESLELMSLRSRPIMDNAPQSYVFPEDPTIPNWRPFSMRSPYIFFLAVISLGLAIFQEWFCRHSMALVKDNKGILQFNQVAEVSVLDFFSWKYLPTMITIIYAVLFSIMDYDIRRLEPYYQLSKREGSPAAASLNLDHLTMFQYFVPFKAARLRQWPVFFSTVGNIIASTVAPSIQNPSITLYSNPNCKNQICPGDQKLFFVVVSPGWSRALSATLVVVAAIAVVLFLLLRRKSGLLSDPKGIAGIASMATKSHILADFQGMDLATRKQIHKRLQHRRFVLYKSSIWQGEWSPTTEPFQESESRLESPHPLMLQLKAGIPLLCFLVFGLVSVPLISVTPARVVPNVVPWLPILLATLLKLFFSTFESDVRLMEPFHCLSEGNALPQNSLTLDYQGTVYGWIVIKAAMNKHFLVALVGLASISLDVLSVTVSSFSVNSQIFLRRNEGADPSNQDETWVSFWTSLILSIVILLFVIVVTCVVYWRRRHPFLPREPSTIAAVLAFIYASNMLDDFVNTEKYTNKEMEKKLKELGKRYALGWFKGRDGKMHCAIDQEPLRSKYVHGVNYTLSQAPWEQQAENERFYP